MDRGQSAPGLCIPTMPGFALPPSAAAHIGKVYIGLLSIVFLWNSVLEVAASETTGWAGKGVVWGGWAMGAGSPINQKIKQ